MSIIKFGFDNTDRADLEELLQEIQYNNYGSDSLVKILSLCYRLLNTSELANIDYNLCLKVICVIADKNTNDLLVLQLLSDCIISSRVFLYDDMMRKNSVLYDENIKLELSASFGKAYYTLDTSTTLTKDQKYLFNQFKKHRRLIVSAPTSFGKSRVIDEIIIHNDYHSIIIVLPTIALLWETYFRLNQNSSISEKFNVYCGISKTMNIDIRTRNIFILTPERTDLLLDSYPDIQLEFFVMDEIYKIQGLEDDRSKMFAHCLYRLSKFNSDFYLIGPYFEKFSDKFKLQTASKELQFRTELVQKNIYDLNLLQIGDSIDLNVGVFVKYKTPDVNLKTLSNIIKGQTLVYVGNPMQVEVRAKFLANLLEDQYYDSFINYLETNISPEWSLVHCLKHRVAFHHGSLPKFAQSEIVDLFNNGILNTIVCSTTITEGVNTTAKNVIIYDDKKGRMNLSNFDIKNIQGRAGRVSSHFIGNVYMLAEANDDESLLEIEYSYLDNEHLLNEELLQIEKNELKSENLYNKILLELQISDLGIDISILKMNKFVDVMGQVNLIEYLRDNLFVFNNMNSISGIPNKNQLDIILESVFDFLFNESDKNNRTFNLLYLKKMVAFYIYESPTVKQIIDYQDGKIDTKVRTTFKLLRNYFEFKLPKYISAFEILFNYVSNDLDYNFQHIDLNWLIAKLEFGFFELHEICLKEVNIPDELIRKVSSRFAGCYSFMDIKYRFRQEEMELGDLSDFEIKILNKYL